MVAVAVAVAAAVAGPEIGRDFQSGDLADTRIADGGDTGNECT